MAPMQDKPIMPSQHWRQFLQRLLPAMPSPRLSCMQVMRFIAQPAFQMTLR